MADQVTVRDEGAKFQPHPEGQFPARCVDVINLGLRVETFQGKSPRVVKKAAIVFDTGTTGETGEPLTVHTEFTLSMFERAGLRLFLESWRGRSYTEEEATAGVPLDKLEGHAALLSVEHKRSASGRMYAKIKTISPLPKGLPVPDGTYKRAEFWAKRKEEYALEVAKHRAQHASQDDGPSYDPLGDDDLDDSLPF